MLEWLRNHRYGKKYGYEVLFRRQSRKVTGKPGIILAELGMPEDYKPEFYTAFMDHVFDYSLPWFLHRFILADRGIALIDPSNPLAREPFTPSRLVDMHGSFTNRDGVPYVDCKVEWRPPGMKKNPADHGYFLYTGNGKGGAPDICQKTGAKIAGWYFGHLIPEKRVAWESQCKKIYDESVALLSGLYPDAEFRLARYTFEESLRQAVEELLASGCETIIYQSFCNPVYSDFEDYAFAIPAIHRIVNGRARIIWADQLGNQPSMREAYVQLLRDNLTQIPVHSKLLLILSKHGHPFKNETMDLRGPEYRTPLEISMRQALSEWGGHCDLVWSDDEYADEYWDRRNRKFSTYSAYRKAIEESYDYAVEIPTDFIAENTDLMFYHAMKKFTPFSEYNHNHPVHYPDWEQPLRRTFREGVTTGIYAGCPVGEYRKHIVGAVVGSISEILNTVDGKRHTVTGTRNQVTGTRNQVTGTRNQATGTRNQVTGTRNQAKGTRNQVPGTRNQVTGTSNQESDTRNQVPGTRNRAAGELKTEAGTEAGNSRTSSPNRAKDELATNGSNAKLKVKPET